MWGCEEWPSVALDESGSADPVARLKTGSASLCPWLSGGHPGGPSSHALVAWAKVGSARRGKGRHAGGAGRDAQEPPEGVRDWQALTLRLFLTLGKTDYLQDCSAAIQQDFVVFNREK